MRFNRVCVTAVLLVAGWLVTACGSKGGATPEAGGDAAPAADTVVPAAAPAQPPQVSYDVDPENVAAAIEYDSAARTMTLPIVAGLTSNNNAWNFNGQARGAMTIVVPAGTAVEMPFANMDADASHSFGVVPGTAATVPAQPGDPVFPGALTTRYETGIPSAKTDLVRFTADKAGRYLFVCGVPGHATNGMWVWLEVSNAARRPAIRIR